MRRAATSGARRAATGTGIIERTRRLMSVEIPCPTLLTLPYSSTEKQSKRWRFKQAKRTTKACTRLRSVSARPEEILTHVADVLDL